MEKATTALFRIQRLPAATRKCERTKGVRGDMVGRLHGPEIAPIISATIIQTIIEVEFVKRDLEGMFERLGCPDAGHPPDIFPERSSFYLLDVGSPKCLSSTLFTRSYGQPIYPPLVRFAASSHKHRADNAWRNPADVSTSLAELRVLPTVLFGCKSRLVSGPDREGSERAARIGLTQEGSTWRVRCYREWDASRRRATLRIALKPEGSVGDTSADHKNLS